MHKEKSLLSSFLLLLAFLPAFSQSGAQFFRAAEQKIRDADYNAAVELYTKAIEADSTNMNYVLKRGFACGLAARFEEAVLDYSSILNKMPDQIYALTSRGSAFNKLGKYEEALADFNRVLEIDPKNQEAFNNRGWSKKFLGDFEGACKDWHLSKRMGNEEAKIILKNNACR